MLYPKLNLIKAEIISLKLRYHPDRSEGSPFMAHIDKDPSLRPGWQLNA